MKTFSERILSLIWCFLIFHSPNSYAEGIENKKLVAYIGGVNELVKIDVENHKIVKRLRFPGGGHIVFGLDISPDGKKIYATGDMFSAPMIQIDSKTLEIAKSLPEKGFEETKIGGQFGNFGCRGKVSPDGNTLAIDCGTDSAPFAIIDMQTFKIINQLSFSSNPIYEAFFSDDDKLLYVLTGVQVKQKKILFENKIIILDTETGKILKQFSLQKFGNIKCQTNISGYIGEGSDVFITCYRNFYDSHGSESRGLLKGNEIYPFISASDLKRVKLIEVKTGKIISEIPIPNGRGQLNLAVLTPDTKKLLICRGSYRHPGELTIVDVKSKKVIKRIMLEGGATSNVVFGHE